MITLSTAGVAGVGFLLLGGIPLFNVFAQFSRYYEFTVAESPDGLRLRHGLLQKTRQTVPPGRVQAVGFVQPFLWRKRGWVRVRLNIAGASTSAQGSGDQSFTENVLLPVAPWPVALAIVGRVLPGVDIMAIPLIPAPERSRRRAWIQWRQLAVGWTDEVFITRSGRITERWDVVPHARTQSVRVTQGPWQRSLGLASMHVDSTPGRGAHHRPPPRRRRGAPARAGAGRPRRERPASATARCGGWRRPPVSSRADGRAVSRRRPAARRTRRARRGPAALRRPSRPRGHAAYADRVVGGERRDRAARHRPRALQRVALGARSALPPQVAASESSRDVRGEVDRAVRHGPSRCGPSAYAVSVPCRGARPRCGA